MDDHEDRLITETNFFITLRKKLPTNSKSDSKRTHVEECIKNGADVNTRFANDSNNTPLHIAVMKAESEIVDLLLRYGAQTNVVNDAGKTALDLAKNLPDRSHIVELITAHEERLKKKCVIHQPGETNDSATIHEYKKRPGTANVRGQLYETKLLTMIYFRALRCKEITQFHLATNVDEVGDMDDVCLRFKTENRDYVVFLQAKYKHDVVKGKIRYHDLWQPTNDFSLLKCYDSYMNVRQKFNINSADEFFRGKYEDIKPYFVMYTTIKEDIKDISKVQPIVDDVVDNLIGTGKRQHIFQFTSEDKNIELIVNTLLKGQMRNMGKRFVQFLREKKYDLMLTDDNIKCFHVVLARKVIKVNDVIENGYRTGTFRDEFFSTNDQLLIELRETLFAEVDEKVSMNPDEIDLLIQKILREPTSENISKLIGSILIYNRNNNSLNLINEGTSWIRTYQKRLASLQIPESVVNQAIVISGRRKLQSLQLKFPIGFGNLDMTINENKRASRLDHLATKICELIKNSSDKQNVVIREGVFSSVKKQESKLLDINGGIGGAVGNLLISDGENKLKFNLDDGSMKENARGLLERLTTALGDLQIYRFLIDVDYFPRLSLHGSLKEKRFAKDFFDSLYFYTLQKKEEKLEETVTQELQKYECKSTFSAIESCIKSNALFLKVHNQIQIWWMLEKTAKYLTRNMEEFDKIFRDMKKKGLLTFLNFIYLNEINHINLEFNSEALDVFSASKSDTKDATVTVIHTDVTMLSFIKLVQYLKDTENYLFLDIDYVYKVSPYCLEMIIGELSVTDILNVVIICEDITKYNVIDMICACRAMNVTLLTSKVAKTEDCVLKDDRINLTDLTVASQAKVLENQFTYQGFEVTFAEIFDETMKNHINAKILQKIINRDHISLGQNLALSTYEEMKYYYVPRTVKYNERLSEGDENLDDYTKMSLTTYDEIENSDIFTPTTLFDHRAVFKDQYQKQQYDVVLLLNGPGMGKSTLLTHLSLETKKQYPKVWIQRVNLLDHSKQFHDWREQNIKIDDSVALNFLCSIELSKVTSEGKGLNLHIDLDDDVDNEVSCKEDDVLMAFELNVFLKCFKEGRIVFIFDGVDEICPTYKEEVMQLLKCLACRSQVNMASDSESKLYQMCVWIASRPYNDIRRILENEFGNSYSLQPFSYKTISLFLDKYMKRNLSLNSLTEENLKNIDDFFVYMKSFKLTEDYSENDLKPINVSLYSIYVAALKYFQCEIRRTHLTDDLLAYVEQWESQMSQDFFKYYLSLNDTVTLSGVPLHVYLAVHYFETQIRDTSLDGIEDVKTRWELDINAFTFYQSFFDTKLKTILFEEKNCMDTTKPGVMEIFEKEKRDLFDAHKKLAFYALFKENVIETELNEVVSIFKNMNIGKEKTGLIDKIVNGVPRFVHYTFAEYFAVEYIVDNLKSGDIDKQKRMMDLMMERILGGAMIGILVFLDLKFKLDPALSAAFTGPRLTTQNNEYVIDEASSSVVLESLPDSLDIFGCISFRPHQ